jgi:hypothetical protein
LNAFFDVVALSSDGIGQRYVSMVEAKTYSSLNKKHQFEYATKALHTFELIQMGQHFSN